METWYGALQQLSLESMRSTNGLDTSYDAHALYNDFYLCIREVEYTISIQFPGNERVPAIPTAKPLDLPWKAD